MATGFLNIRDERVQNFLWDHLVPSDLRWDYTRADAFRFVMDEVMLGSQWLVGDLDRNVMLRIAVHNPKVIEPHIMGDAAYMRSVVTESIPLAWERGIQKIMVWTQHQSIGVIMERMGFVKEGEFPRMHFSDGKLHDLAVYSLERPAA